jgi:hypothetical protein
MASGDSHQAASSTIERRIDFGGINALPRLFVSFTLHWPREMSLSRASPSFSARGSPITLWRWKRLQGN